MMNANRRDEQGYVMVLALVTILVLALGLTVAAQQVSSTQKVMVQLEGREQFKLDALSARNRIAFALIKDFEARSALATEAITQPSISRSPLEQAADAKLLQEKGIWTSNLIDRPALLGDVYVTVLAETGLVDLASRDDAYLTYVAARMGATQPASAVAALRDFTDADSLVTLNGAEQSSYGDEVIVPNAPLRRIEDICLVMHWKDTRLCTDRGWRARVATLSEGRYWLISNAGETALRAMLGGLYSDNAAENFVAWDSVSRAEGFFDIEQIGGRLGPRYVVLIENLDKSFARREQILVLAPEAARPYEILQEEEFALEPPATTAEE